MAALFWLTHDNHDAPSAAPPQAHVPGAGQTPAKSRFILDRQKARLKEVDLREAKSTAATADQRTALEKLRHEVPGVKVDFDPITGAPSHVMAAGKFLARGEPGAKDPYQPVRDFVSRHKDLFGQDAAALAAGKARVTREDVTAHNGMRTVVWQQEVAGIPVFQTILKANLTKDGDLVTLGSHFLRDAAQAAADQATLAAAPPVSATQALGHAAASLGEQMDTAKVMPQTAPEGAEQSQKLNAPGHSDTTAHLSWVPLNDSKLRLAWELETFSLQQNEMFRLLIDAENGTVLVRQSLTADISNATYRVYTGDSPSPFSPGHDNISSVQPPSVPRQLVTIDALNPTASPNGWINDGDTQTLGNNVDAHTDVDANNSPDLPRPTSATRVFDFAADLTQSPSTYKDAAVTNLFYWTNVFHDRMYSLGFTETAGNFQTNNFGRGGNGNDPVQADAQDGSGTDNANFSTPSDGSSGRMQMFLWTGPNPDRDGDFEMEVVLHELTHGVSNRLVGGGVGISTNVTGGMGEGWSDFVGLALLAEPGENLAGNWARGGWSRYLLSGIFTENYYYGGRRYPYSTNLTKNPLTFKDIDPVQRDLHTGIPISPMVANTADQVHNIGNVWCVTLWELRAAMITKHGWPGNELTLQMVIDGMKLSPANPSFVQARDAILQADLVTNGGANRNELWAAFAKRGLGYSASAPASSYTSGLVEAYDVPDDLGVTPVAVLAATGSIGGPFTPASRIFTLQNSGSASLAWTASTSAPWMVLSRSSGSLDAGSTMDVTVSFGSGAASLPLGVYSGTVTFTNTTSGAIIARTVTLTVEPLRVTIFAEPFASPTLSSAWTVTGTGPFRTQVTSLNGPRSSNHLTMDSTTDGSYARNEATFTVNLAGQQDVELSFWAKGFGEDPDGPPASPFINGADFDGVAISADGGTTWYEVQPLRGLTSDWAKYTVDLDAAVASRGLAYNANFKIRFNQYDNYAIATDGIAIDDILVAQSINNGLALALPVSAATEGDAAITATLTVSPVQTSPLTVSLAASRADVSVPATIEIPVGVTQVTFPVTVVDDALLDGSQQVAISANAATFNPGAASLTVHDNEAAVLTLNAPVNGIEGTSEISGTVSVDGVVDAAVTVALESSDPAASVPSSVVIPAGQSSAEFFITLTNDPYINGTRGVTFTARVTGWTPGTDNFSILDDENANLVLTQMVPAVSETDGVRTQAVRVSVNGLTQSDLVITLASNDASELVVPASVTLPAGTTQAAFDVTAVNDNEPDGPQNVTVTASAPGFVDGTLVVTVHDDEAAPVAWNPRPAHLSTNNPVTTDLAWGVSEGNLITNGDFESGTLEGWSFNAPGPMFRLQNGTLDPPGNDTPTEPGNGSASMIFAPSGSTGIWTMYQDVAVPPDGPAPALQWMQRIRNTGTTYTATQQYRVEIRDPATDAVLATPFLTAPGSALFQDWAAQSADLSPWRGRSVRVAFVVQLSSGIINVLLDDIMVRQRPAGSTYDVYFGTTPTPGPAELLGSTPTPAWNLPNLSLGTTYYWQVVTRNGAQTLPGPVWQFTVPAAGGVASFAWSPISSPQTSGTDIPVTVTALDALGNVAGGFTGQASLSAVLPGITRSGVLITEFSTWSTDDFEFTNISAAPVDISGWKVVLTHLSSFPAPYLTFTIPVGTSLSAGSVFRLQDGGTAPGTFPLFRTGLSANLSPSLPAYVVLVNQQDEVMDFVCVAGDPRRVTYPLPAGAWAGSSLPGVSTNAAAQSYQRVGTRDNNNGSDWQFSVATPGVANAGLTLPFAPAAAPALVPLKTADFTAGVWSGNVRALGAAQNLRLRATEPGGKSGDSAQFNVVAPHGQLALAAGATVSEGAGTTVGFGTVTLPAPAAEAVTVSFVVTPAGQASVADVTIPAGATSAPFALTVVDDSVLEGPHSISITASAAGCTSSNAAAVAITDNENTALTITAPASATEGSGTLAAAVTVAAAAAPLNAVTLTLSSSNTTEATLPATVTLPAGQTSVTVNLGIVNDTLLDGPQTVTLTASATGFNTGTTTLVVEDNEPATLMLTAPATLAENAGTVPAAGTVTLGGVAPADITVTLASNASSALGVPASVTVPAGQSSATFAITVVNDATAAANANVSLTASAAGLPDAVTSVMVRDDDLATFSFAAIASPQKAAGVFPVTLTAQNVSGDALTGFTGTAVLNAPGNSVTPATTTAFSAGVWTGNVMLVNPAAGQTLTATSGSASGTSAAFDVGSGALASFALSSVASPQTANVPFTLTATAKDSLGRELPDYAGPARLVQISTAQQTSVGTFASTTTTSNPLPTSGYNRGRSMMLVRASELGAAAQLTSLSLHFVAQPPPLARFIIRLKPTSLTTVSSSTVWDNTGWQTVYDAPLSFNSAGWTDFAFSNPFFHNGSNHLLVELTHVSPANAAWSGSLTAISAGYTAVVYAAVSSSSTVNADPTLWAGTTPLKSSSSTRPVLRFGSRAMRDATPAALTAFADGVFSGPVSVPLGGTAQALGVWDETAGVFSFTNNFTVTSAGPLVLAFSGNVTEGEAAATGTLSVATAPLTDLVITLAATNAGDVTVPATVTIPAGAKTATFTVAAVDDTAIEAVETVVITAMGAGYDAVSGTFTVTDNDTATLAVTLPASVTEGGTAGSGTVTASAASPVPVTISLAAAPTGLVTVPASVTLPAGQTSATFSISAVNNTAIDGTRNATVTASTTGWTSGSGTVDVIDNEALTLAVNVALTTPAEGAGTVSGSVVLSGTTPTALTVSLASDDTSEATVPATVTINAGASSASFTLTVVDDALMDGTQPVTLTATAAGFQNGTRALQILDNDVAGLTFATVPGPQICNTPFSVTVKATDINGVAISSFAGSATLSAAGSGGAVAITPATTSSFVNGVWTGGITLAQGGTGVALTAQVTGGPGGVSNTFNVLDAGALTQFAISPLGAARTSGEPVPVTVTAQDAAGNPVTGYNGNVSFTATGPSGSDVVTGTGTGTVQTVLLTGAHDGRSQNIFTPAEVGGARTLRSMAMDVAVPPGQPLNKFTIRMKHTTKADYSATGAAVMEGSGWTTVYQSPVQSITATGWNTFTFQNSFAYDGVQNLMVDVCFDNTFASAYGSVRYTSTSPGKSLWALSNSTDGDPRLWSGATAPLTNVSTGRPNLRFSGFVPVTVTPAASTPFVGGVWSGEVTFGSSGAGVTLRALNGGGIQGVSNAFDLNGTVLDHFNFATISATQTAGTGVPVTVTARDVNHMPVPGFSGPATLTGAERDARLQIGTATTTSSIPLGSQNRTQRMQVIYTAAELGAGGRTLNGLDLNVIVVPASPLRNFTIRVKHTTKADFATAGTAVWESSGWTTVCQQDVTVLSTGWLSFPFTTPFEYDGTRNLMVDFSYYNDAVGVAQGAIYQTAAATNRSLTRQTDVDEGSPLTWHELSSPLPTASTAVPNVRFASGADVTVTPLTTGAFTQGVWTGTVTVSPPKNGVQLTASAAGHTGTSGAFNVGGIGTLSLTLAATAAEGDAPLTATVTRTGSTANVLQVSLSSSDTTEATVDPGGVLIPAGSASATFPVTIVNDASADGPQTVVITAATANHTAGAATLTVTDDEPLTLAVYLPQKLTESTTAPGSGRVTINRPAATSLTVSLSSSDTTELTVPTSVSIPAGATSATFTLTVLNDTLLDGPQTVLVTATAAGYVTGTGSTVVEDNEAQNLNIGTSAISEGAASLQVGVSLGGITSVDVPVTLTVGDTSELLVAPNTSTPGSDSVTVTVAANTSSTTFALVPQNDDEKDGNQSVTVTLSAPGYPTMTRFVQVTDDELDRYFIAPVASPQTANAAFGMTVTARNVDDIIIALPTHTLNLTAANATGAVPMTPATVTVTNGTGAFNALFTTGAAGVSITATSTEGISAQSSVFDVLGTAGLARFDWTIPAGPKPVEGPLAVTVAAKDAAGNTVTAYPGPVNVKAFAPAADLTIGTGTSSWTTPLGSLAYARTQSLYLPSEMGAAKRLTGLALNVVTSSSTLLNNFTIRMKHSTATSFASASWDNAGWVTVYQGARTFSATGWQNTVLTRPFDYDGTSSLMVDISFGNSGSGNAAGLQYTTVSPARSVALNSTTSSGLPTTWTGTTPTSATSTNLLNMRFTNATPVTTTVAATSQVTVGTGTESIGVPFGTFCHDERTQMIYTAAEIGAATNITSVALDVVQPPGQTMNGFTIRMKHTPLADYSGGAAWESSGWTTVYSGTQTISTTGWNTFTLTTPFAYNGTSNLMVDISFNNSSYTDDGYCNATTTPTERVIYTQTDSNYGDPLTWNGAGGDGVTPYPYSLFYLPNMRFSGNGTAAAAAVTPATTGGFTHGVWAGDVTPLAAAAPLFFAAEDPATGITGYSNTITITSGGALALAFPYPLREGDGIVSNGATLTLPAAPALAVTVSLSSASPSVLTVPATVTVPAGQTSVPVPVTIINDSVIDGPQTAAVTATAPGYTRVTTTATVADNDGGTFTITAPAATQEGAGSFTATLNASATSPVAVTVSLSSSDTTELTVPGSITMPANASSVNFTVTVVDDALQDGTQTATLTASAGGWTSGTAMVNVADNEAPVLLSLYTYGLVEGGTATSPYVYISPAPTTAVTITLASSDTSVITVPATVTIGAGSSFGTFTITAPENTESTGTRYATLVASAPGYRAAGSIVSVTENDPSAYKIANIAGTPVAGAPTSVTVTAIAPDGSTVSAYSGTASLSAASGAGGVPVTPTVTGAFSSGTWTGSVAFNKVDTGIVLTASDAQGRTGSSAPFNTTFGTLDHFTWGAVSSPQTASTPFAATVTAKDVYENTVGSFTGTTRLTGTKNNLTTISGTSTGTDWYPFGGYYPQTRAQMIYPPATVGATARRLQGMSFDTITGSTPTTLTNVTIRLKHGSSATSTGWETTGWTTVFQGTVVMNKVGWNDFLFSTPFDYDGTSYLMVDITNDSPSAFRSVNAKYSSGGSMRFVTTSGQAAPLTWSGATPYSSNTSVVPNMRLISYLPTAILPSQTTPFTAGTWTGPVAFASAGNSSAVTAREPVSGVQGTSNLVTVTSMGTLSLSMTTTATEGDAPLTATLSVGAAPASSLDIPMVSSNPGAATVPASVTIPAGQTSVTFPVAVVDDALLDGTQTTEINAALPGYEAGLVTLAVADNETTTITFTLPATIAENAAATTGTVNLGAAAGSAVVLPLTSSDTGELKVPASVTIPAGATSATFALTPVDDSVIDFAQTVNITTSMAGWTGATGTVSVTDNEAAILSLSYFVPVSEEMGSMSVSVSTPTPVEKETTISLFSADTTEATVPATITLAAGASSASFTITIVDDTEKDGTQTVAISASAPGFTSGSRNLSVADNEVHNFLISTISGPKTRNERFSITITPRDVANSTITSYTGSPVLTARDGASILPITPAAATGFFSGSATVYVTIDSFAANAVITVADTVAGASGSSNPFVVTFGAHAKFGFAAIPSPQTPGVPFSTTISALDAYNNLVTTFTGTAALSVPSGQMSIGSAGGTVTPPLRTGGHDCRSQLIYLASEIGGAKGITSAALNVATLPGQAMNGFTIRMKHTTSSSLSTSWENGDWTVCYQTNQTISATGWNTFTFTTPFAYNGIDNLLVDVSFNNSSTSTSGSVVSTFVGSVRHSYNYSNSTNGDPLTWSGSSPIAIPTYDRPDMLFGYGGSGGTVTPATTGSFAGGVWTGSVTVPAAASNISLLATSGSLSGVSNAFNASLGTLSVTLPASAVESAGSVSGTVSIPSALGSALVVSLVSNDTTEATPAASTVTIPAGSTSANFTLTIVNDALRDGAQGTIITASASGASNGSTTISVVDDDPDSFTWATISSPKNSGVNFSVTINARTVDNQPATAMNGIGGTLSATVGGVSKSVTPSSSGAFSGAAAWTGNVSVVGTGTTTLTITSGSATGTSNSFMLSPPTLSVTLPASAVESAGGVSGSVTISAAQTAATIVNLSSNDTTEASPANTSITIPAGSTSASFTLLITNDALTDGAQTATITASSTAATSGTATISVVDDDPYSLVWSSITSPKTSGVAFPVTISARTIDSQPATAINGSTASLSVSAGSATVTPGTTTTFSAAVWTGNVAVSGSGTINLMATKGAASGTSNSFTLSLPVLSVTLPASAAESAGTVTGTVSVPSALGYDLVVSLSSNDTTEAEPATATVTIPAASFSASFTLNIVNDTLKDGAQTATITASATGMTSATGSISVSDDDVQNFLVSAVASPQVRGTAFNVTFTARDVNNVTIPTYAGSPVLTAADGATLLNVGPATVTGFSSGVKTQAVTVSTFATGAVLTLTDPATGGSGSSNAFGVSYGGFHHFGVLPVASPQVAGVPFAVTVAAQDANNNTVGNYSGAASPLDYSSLGAGSTTVGTGTGSTALVLTGSAARNQIIYLASELGTAQRIRGLRLTVNTAPPGVVNNFTIRLKHTPLAGYPTSSTPGFEDTGWTTVYAGNLASLPTGPAAFDFATPFDYNGVGNLMVDLSFTNAGGQSASGTLSTFTAGGLRSALVPGNTAPVLTYGTPIGGGSASANVPVITFLRDSQITATPAMTGTFANGTWTGSVTVSTPVTGLMMRPVSSGSTPSNAFDVIPAAPSVVAEPAFTGGTSNTVAWNSVPAATSYRIQVSDTADFATVLADSGAVQTLSRTFNSLASGQPYFYRLQAATPGVSATGVWSQTFTGEFVTGTPTNMALSEPTDEVHLAKTPRVQVENFDGGGATDLSATLFSDVGGGGNYYQDPLSTGPSTTPALPINQGGDMEARLSGMGSAVLMPTNADNVFTDGSIEAYLGPESTSSFMYTGLLLRASRSGTNGTLNGYLANILGFAGGSASVSLIRVNNGSDSGGTNGILYPTVGLPALAANEHWKMRFTATGPTLVVQVWKVRVTSGSVSETLATTVTRVDHGYTSGVAGLYSSQSTTNGSLFDDVTVTKGNGAYASSGTLVSPALAPPSKLRWGVLSFNASTPAGTSVVVDVFNGANDALLSSAVASGTDLSTLPAVVMASSIKLKATLATTNTAVTPALLDWSLTYPMVDGGTPVSQWSAAVSSTQDAVPPVISAGEMTTSGASATLAGTTTDALSGVSSVTVAGNEASTANAFATWSSDLGGLVEGPNSFTITAKDNAVPPNTTTVTTIVYRIASPTGDANNNGIESLLEHALGIPAAAANPRAMLPAATVQTDSGTGAKYLTMQFRRRLQRTGLIYSVQTSTNLTAWDNTGASVQEVSATPTGDGVTELVTVRVTPAISTVGQKFVRLQVTTN